MNIRMIDDWDSFEQNVCELNWKSRDMPLWAGALHHNYAFPIRSMMTGSISLAPFPCISSPSQGCIFGQVGKKKTQKKPGGMPRKLEVALPEKDYTGQIFGVLYRNVEQ